MAILLLQQLAKEHSLSEAFSPLLCSHEWWTSALFFFFFYEEEEQEKKHSFSPYVSFLFLSMKKGEKGLCNKRTEGYAKFQAERTSSPRGVWSTHNLPAWLEKKREKRVAQRHFFFHQLRFWSKKIKQANAINQTEGKLFVFFFYTSSAVYPSISHVVPYVTVRASATVSVPVITARHINYSFFFHFFDWTETKRKDKSWIKKKSKNWHCWTANRHLNIQAWQWCGGARVVTDRRTQQSLIAIHLPCRFEEPTTRDFRQLKEKSVFSVAGLLKLSLFILLLVEYNDKKGKSREQKKK